MKEVLIVGLGGFAGSISRYLIQLAVISRFTLLFPLGTFGINLVGSLIVGLIFGYAERFQWMNPEWRLFLAIGFCGSFTTFSSFAFDNLRLLEDNNYYQLFWYVSLSLILSVVLTWGGYSFAKA